MEVSLGVWNLCASSLICGGSGFIVLTCAVTRSDCPAHLSVHEVSQAHAHACRRHHCQQCIAAVIQDLQGVLIDYCQVALLNRSHTGK